MILITKKSAIIISQYVHEHTLPIEVNLDDGASWKLLHGSIWCDEYQIYLIDF